MAGHLIIYMGVAVVECEFNLPSSLVYELKVLTKIKLLYLLKKVIFHDIVGRAIVKAPQYTSV